MKQVTRLSVLIALLIVQCHVSNAQILYNSAFAYLTNTNVPTPSAAFVREYSANLSIICTYITPRLYPHLIMVDAVSGYTSPAIPLDQMQYVSDMRIDNGYVYFCGISNNTLSPYPPMLAMVLWTSTHSCPQHHLVIMSSIDISII